MKKGLKYSLIGCGSLVGICVVAAVLGVFWLIGGDESSSPTTIEYRNADDLYRISNVKFPEVQIVDSSHYESFSLRETTVKFVLKDKSQYDSIIVNIEAIMPTDSIYWSVEDNTYKYYILPEEPINRPAGSGWRMAPEGIKDWDGRFIRMEIPKAGVSDTITLKYGWER